MDGHQAGPRRRAARLSRSDSRAIVLARRPREEPPSPDLRLRRGRRRTSRRSPSATRTITTATTSRCRSRRPATRTSSTRSAACRRPGLGRAHVRRVRPALHALHAERRSRRPTSATASGAAARLAPAAYPGQHDLGPSARRLHAAHRGAADPRGRIRRAVREPGRFGHPAQPDQARPAVAAGVRRSGSRPHRARVAVLLVLHVHGAGRTGCVVLDIVVPAAYQGVLDGMAGRL